MNRITCFCSSLLRGAGQVMFMGNVWTGALFLAGIVVGSWMNGTAIVVVGAVVGLLVSTLAGLLLREKESTEQGLHGFNAILIGCALPTFFTSNWAMWLTLVILSALSPLARQAMNRPLAKLGINSLTFPFIAITWLAFCLGFPSATAASPQHTSLFAAWLNGISQVFLICSPVCGALLLAGLFVADRCAAVWCALGSALGLALAFLLGQDEASIASGLYGFNPALTALALGAVFRKSVPMTIVATLATVLIQLALTRLLAILAIPAMTAPFCLATWLFLIKWKRCKRP